MIKPDATRRHHPTWWIIPASLAITLLLAQSRPAQAQQWATNGTDIYNTNTGEVGIGTTTPAVPLHVYGKPNTTTFPGLSYNLILNSNDPADSSTNNGVNRGGGIAFGGSYTGTTVTNFAIISGVKENQTLTNYAGALLFATRPGSGGGGLTVERMRISSTGNVGIGTSSPAFKLDVLGQFNASGGLCIAGVCKADWSQIGNSQWTTSGTAIYYSAGSVGIGVASPQAALDVNGSINVSGNINAKYQDVAEWVPATHALSAGTVVVLNPAKSNEVMASFKPYDTSVAGVVSERPGLALGEAGKDKLLVATTGRVKVKADATRAPIRVGDLLVTSDRQGVAMRSEPVDLGGIKLHRPGTLIGKALEPLESGTGEILVLLSLQ